MKIAIPLLLIFGMCLMGTSVYAGPLEGRIQKGKGITQALEQKHLFMDRLKADPGDIIQEIKRRIRNLVGDAMPMIEEFLRTYKRDLLQLVKKAKRFLSRFGLFGRDKKVRVYYWGSWYFHGSQDRT